MNGEFYNSSFNDDEKEIISSSDLGKVFLLSEDEAEGYFDSDDERKCEPTEYAKANGAWVSEDDCCMWWLRSPSPNVSINVYYVFFDGCIAERNFDNSYGCARPALWINLDENPFKGANVGDIVKFGRYPQTAGGGIKGIEWRVLAVENGRVLAISRYGLDAKTFDDDSNDWESSEIRKWLNNEFYDGSFNDDEKGMIASSDPGKVFLLSNEEAEGYFDSNKDRKCKPTEYARANGAWVSEDGCCDWWLRSPYGSNYVYCVDYIGAVSSDIINIYDDVCSNDVCERPALWINTESE